MILLPQQPEPISRQVSARTERFLWPVKPALEAFFVELRLETDREIGPSGPGKYGKPYPYGYCREITLDVLARLKANAAHSTHPGARALRAYFKAGGAGRCVWGILRDQYFQTALQFGTLYVDVANDTVDATKEKIEMLPMAQSGLEAVRDARHFASIAESYWHAEVYANHAIPSLAPLLPMITLLPTKVVQIQSATHYLVYLFRLDGFARAEEWVTRGPAPPSHLIEAVRNAAPADLLAANPEAGAEAAASACRSARSQGLAKNLEWRNARILEFRQIGSARV